MGEEGSQVGQGKSPKGETEIHGQVPFRHHCGITALAVWTSYLLNNKTCTSSSTYRNTNESASQFNREYRRFFDQPPIRDTKALREGKVVAITAA
jgi:hypothetical protein